MQVDPRAVIIQPVMTERSTLLREKNDQYVFRVALKATKGQVRSAVEELFNVKVDRVRTMVVLGKKRVMGRHSGYRADWKKALVRLEKGQKIDVNAHVA